MRMILVLATVCLCACTAPTRPSTTHSQTVFMRADGNSLDKSEIDATVMRLMRAADVHGLGLALIDDSGIAYLKAYGSADIDEGRQLQTDTIMYGASFTKALFAYMVMTLVDEGVVDLDRPIEGYLPKPLHEYEDYTDLAGDPRWRVWTLRSLLSHTSGLPN